MKKVNISIESASKEYIDFSQKIIDLKNKIENEINTINELYEKTINDLTKSFQIKHENLLKEENQIKEKLQNEVTKVKEKLELYWSKSNEQIKMSERIKQGLNKLKNEDKNINKTLSYISKINKNQKESLHLLQEPIKNIKFSYQEENSNLKYDEYYFNGISIPKNIEIKDISYQSLNLSWKIDNIGNIDNNKIKYKVEIKKEKQQFIQIYEGNNLNCLIDNLDPDTEYELRICSIYNDIPGAWSEVQKTKTLDIDFDSIILKDEKRKKEFYLKILEWTGYKKMELIYRGSRDSMTSNNFHNKCDNKGPTITLYKNEKNIFGGFSPISWSTDGNWHASQDCFIFSLVNIYNSEPIKFPVKNMDQYSVLHGSGYGPIFGGGCDIGVNYSDFLNNYSYSSFPSSYQDTYGKGYSIFSADINNKKFKLKEVEVFKIFK